MGKVSEIVGPTVVDGEGKDVDVDSFCKAGKYVGLYFSAHWCPPCRGFTPQLATFYNKMKDSGKLEIVFISSDRDEDSFKDYFKEMPWLALKYSDRDRKASLSELYGVRGIPTFILLDAETGKTVNANARGDVSSDPEGTNFPWKKE